MPLLARCYGSSNPVVVSIVIGSRTSQRNSRLLSQKYMTSPLLLRWRILSCFGQHQNNAICQMTKGGNVKETRFCSLIDDIASLFQNPPQDQNYDHQRSSSPSRGTSSMMCLHSQLELGIMYDFTWKHQTPGTPSAPCGDSEAQVRIYFSSCTLNFYHLDE
jgi:hypothetical protein